MGEDLKSERHVDTAIDGVDLRLIDLRKDFDLYANQQGLNEAQRAKAWEFAVASYAVGHKDGREGVVFPGFSQAVVKPTQEAAEFNERLEQIHQEREASGL